MRSTVRDFRPWFIFLVFSFLYVGLAWIVSGGDAWWVIDHVDGQNVFFGDDAYRFFLSRSVWVNPDLYTYNFVLPGQLFLDGVVTRLVEGDLFLSRCAHGLVGAGGLALLYLCGHQLGLSRAVMLAAVLVMGLLPRYALMSLSFYGEAWLGFFLILTLFLFLKKGFMWMSFVASWLPLLRPEGIFFLIPIGLYLAKEKRGKELAVLILPGFLYFLFLCFSLPSLSDYQHWRQELRTILAKLDPRFGEWDLFFLYSFLFTVPAVLGLFSRAARRIWPFLLGALLWIAWFQLLLLTERATFENRYSFVLIPVVTLLWGAFFHWLTDCGGRYWPARWAGTARHGLVYGVALAVIGLHLDKMHNVQQAVRKYGYSGLVERVLESRWDELYGYRSAASLKAAEDIAATIEALVAQDPGIDKIAIYTHSVFYLLDPEKIPRHVTVGFLTNGYMVFHLLLEGQSFIQHSGGRMYSYLDYGEPDFSEGEKRAIVVTIMPLENYPYTWKRDLIEMYLFSYIESDHARVDVSDKPKLTPQILNEAYAPWYGK